MFFYFGTRECGRVEVVDGTYVCTHFFAINLVPIFPIRSELHLASGERHPISMHPASIAAAYLRAVPVVGFLWAALSHALGGARIAVALTSALLLAVGHWVMGRVSADEAARRRMTAVDVGEPIPLALVPERLAGVRERLRVEFERASLESGEQGYRGRADLERAASFEDPAAVRMAFALSRIEGAMAPPEERARYAALEERLWSRVRHFDARGDYSAAGVFAPSPPALDLPDESSKPT